MLLFRKNTPRWLIFLIDISVCFFSVIFAFLLRFNFNIPQHEYLSLYFSLPTIIIVRSLSFYIGKSYAGIIRYTSTEDAKRIFITILSGSFSFVLINLFIYYFINQKFLIPFSIIIIDFLITMLCMTAFRVFTKIVYFEMHKPAKDKSLLIIYGTDQLGVTTKHTIDRDAGSKLKPVAFIDNTTRNVGKKLEGIPIYHVDSFLDIIEKYDVAKLIIAKPHLGVVRKKEIVELCLQHNIHVASVPEADKWINGELSFNQIKNIKIDELLERPPIVLDEKRIIEQVKDKVILVTGAAGSIGSEIVRQVSNYSPQMIIIYDQAESPLYDLELELNDNNATCVKVIIGDIRDNSKIETIFKTFKPDIIYHSAAYKHVPMMEHHPYEAVKTNVLGTKNLADMAVRYGVTTFVMISTDKAVNPTNVMGASKRIAEIYIQSLNKTSKTNFVTTRFGNVLGSNGSVIPLFKRQIESGGPITITHPEVTRFFMLIPEACQLVLEAGAHSNGGEIYVFDMGSSVKIRDLAEKMVKLSGLELGKDIDLKYTGLRPGEKLYEELLNDQENTLPTHHEKILVAKVREYDFKEIQSKIDSLSNSLLNFDEMEIVSNMKAIVPEFKSSNSEFEKLD